MRIALLGTRGVPARYGGFETCLEEVGSRLAARGHHVTVYCRRSGTETTQPHTRRLTHKGMHLVHLPAVRRRALETLGHTALSITHAIALRRPDVAFVFNAANAPLLPALRAAGIPVATHVDGLEWKRAKWGPRGAQYYRKAEEWAVRWSDALIADAPGISDYYQRQFGAPTQLIAYGAPRTLPEFHPDGTGMRLPEFGLTSREYHLVVARLEPENHVDVIVRGYLQAPRSKPLVVVGTAPYAAQYISSLRALAADRVTFLGAVWDQHALDQLYAHAFTYWHGHSVGGTNPSLLRALGAGAAVCAFDVCFNRDVLGQASQYFSCEDSAAQLCTEVESNPAQTEAWRVAAVERAGAYSWDDVANDYESLAHDLAGGVLRRNRTVSGRRRESAVPTGAPVTL